MKIDSLQNKKPRCPRTTISGRLATVLIVGLGLCLAIPAQALSKANSGAEFPVRPVFLAAGEPAPAALPKGNPLKLFGWDSSVQGARVMAMCQDGYGRLWVGTEGNGVWCWDPALALKERRAERTLATEEQTSDALRKAAFAKAKLYGWTQFTRNSTGGKPEKDGPVLTTGTPDQNSLGDDNVYALACDRQGRIWAGHLNHGVSVYDGRTIVKDAENKSHAGWRNYDVLSGPIGERVFDIAVSPADGDVWIATNAGLSRYRVASDTWACHTRGDGLISDQVQALAFLRNGTVIAGTQCDGLAIAAPIRNGPAPSSPTDRSVSTLEFPSWKWITTKNNSCGLPGTPVGLGLPSNLINDVLVTRAGIILAATTAGIARSNDGGSSWGFLRGEDWDDKLFGLAEPPPKEAIKTASALMPAQAGSLLLEDYCTSLAEDAVGNIWIGHWRRGLEVFDPSLRQRLFPKKDEAPLIPTGPALPDSAYVRTLLALPRGLACFVGGYGEGLRAMEPADFTSPRWQMALDPEAKMKTAILPSPAGVVPLEDLRKRAAASNLKDESQGFSHWGKVVGEDWMTWGDWCGRYGNTLATLCAMSAPLNQEIGYGNPAFRLRDWRIGPHHGKGDCLRHWVHWLSTGNQRVLYSPVVGFRRESEWDDHGETYPYTFEGPDLWFGVDVPVGLHRISVYFFNPNGDDGANRLRDYLVQLRPYEADMRKALAAPVLARTRTRDFHGGGVYKQFVVRGPASYNIQVHRNSSFNTICNGVFIDRLAGPTTWYDWLDVPPAHFGSVLYRRPLANPPPTGSNQELAEYMIKNFVAVSPAATAGAPAGNPYDFCKKLDLFWRCLDNRNDTRAIRLQTMRGLAQNPTPEAPPQLTAWRWDLGLWTSQDRQEFQGSMKRAWDSSVVLNPWMKEWKKR